MGTLPSAGAAIDSDTSVLSSPSSVSEQRLPTLVRHMHPPFFSSSKRLEFFSWRDVLCSLFLSFCSHLAVPSWSQMLESLLDLDPLYSGCHWSGYRSAEVRKVSQYLPVLLRRLRNFPSSLSEVRFSPFDRQRWISSSWSRKKKHWYTMNRQYTAWAERRCEALTFPYTRLCSSFING